MTLVLWAEDCEIENPMRVFVEEGPNALPRMTVYFNAAAQLNLNVDAYDGHPRLNAVTRATNPRFATVLLPLPGETADPEVEFQHNGSGLIVQVTWGPGITDEVFWPLAHAEPPTVKRE